MVVLGLTDAVDAGETLIYPLRLPDGSWQTARWARWRLTPSPTASVVRQFVKASDDQRVFEEPIAAAGGLEIVVGENVEGQVKPPVEFVLPLFRSGDRHLFAYLDHLLGPDRT